MPEETRPEPSSPAVAVEQTDSPPFQTRESSEEKPSHKLAAQTVKEQLTVERKGRAREARRVRASRRAHQSPARHRRSLRARRKARRKKRRLLLSSSVTLRFIHPTRSRNRLQRSGRSPPMKR